MAFVNLTLLVQAVNFFLAYLILKYFLLKPAIAAINAEDGIENHLVSLVHQNHQRISNKQHEIQRKWHECQKSFAQFTPILITESLIKKTTPALLIHGINKHDVNVRAHEIEDKLIKKVAHVRH